MMAHVRAMSSDHVSVAIHEFGGTGRPLLLSHATGFHGYCYLPIADHLGDRFTSYALDYRGHGSTPRPDDWQVDWHRYGDDALAAARAIAPNGGLVAFGHSMGGAGLLMAAHRDPDLFDLIVAFEPIVFPTDADRSRSEPSTMVEGARRRRESFESFEASFDCTSAMDFGRRQRESGSRALPSTKPARSRRARRMTPGTSSPRSRHAWSSWPVATRWAQRRSRPGSPNDSPTHC